MADRDGLFRSPIDLRMWAPFCMMHCQRERPVDILASWKQTWLVPMTAMKMEDWIARSSLEVALVAQSEVGELDGGSVHEVKAACATI